MIVIPYNRFLTDPVNILTDIHERLELPAFEYDPDKVEQITHENDEAHGWKDLHVIRGKVEPPPAEAGWVDILTQEVADEIMKGYSDIAEIAAL